ncbi:mucolipin-3-like [Mya arenaria]|uniref:mucolipin-3-like n=1 Tax=Mya arenaria TaxID=6604 RepID=UPI0022E73540|nr:mucolipin-3-like [Mya arenaria]
MSVEELPGHFIEMTSSGKFPREDQDSEDGDSAALHKRPLTRHPAHIGDEEEDNEEVLVQNTPDSDYTKQTKKLQRELKWYFYTAIKFKNNQCFLHIVYLAIFVAQVIKVSTITTQIFKFGNDRSNFNSVVNRGHIALRHLFLKDWDATWETLPYPPSRGEFALYVVDDLTDAINFAVKSYFNAEKDAIGYYVRLPADTMVGNIEYFDFPGFSDDQVKFGIHIHERSFEIRNGLTETVDSKTGEISYDYSILREFEHLNLTQPIKKMLLTTLSFQLHSVRVYEKDVKARCLRINGKISFQDMDNNGQVNLELDTLTTRIKCAEMNFTSVIDQALDEASSAVGGAVIALTVLSLLITVAAVTCGIVLYWRTKAYMRKYFKQFYKPAVQTENDLPWREYAKFFRLWDILVFVGDILTLYGTIWIVFSGESNSWVLATLDAFTVWLGVGCLLSWLCLLRYFDFNFKFHLLFSTLYRAFWDVMAYLLCIVVMSMGFWVCGYIVLAPYHVKFKSPQTAAESLFTLATGDELFATLGYLETKKSGHSMIFWFSRIYIGIYVAIFTVLVINLLVAIFMGAYDEINKHYTTSPEERNLGPMEKALRKFLKTNTGKSNLRTSIYDLLRDENRRTAGEMSLKRELSKLVRISRTKKTVVLFKPTTLQAFLDEGDDVGRAMNCGCFKCVFVLLRNN